MSQVLFETHFIKIYDKYKHYFLRNKINQKLLQLYTHFIYNIIIDDNRIVTLFGY